MTALAFTPLPRLPQCPWAQTYQLGKGKRRLKFRLDYYPVNLLIFFFFLFFLSDILARRILQDTNSFVRNKNQVKTGVIIIVPDYGSWLKININLSVDVF